MALLQALLSFIGRSAGKILNAIFGWAVIALFGRTSPRQQTILSGLVGAAAAWPVLVLGVAFPKVAAFVIAFVPISDKVPSLAIRVIWLALALAVPLVIGMVVAAKAKGGVAGESFVTRTLRGFPITLGIAGAFVLMFITVPVLRVVSAARGRKDEHVVCITDGEEYEDVAAQIDAIFRQHAIEASKREASWWLSGPATVLRKLGGKALRGFMPERLAYWQGPELEVAFYPSDILIRGKRQQTAWTHGLLAEALAHGPSLQTFDVESQELERQIRQVWNFYLENPRAHVGSAPLLSRLREIVEALGRIPLDYDDWQVVYRKALQLDRALCGRPQILEAAASPMEETMKQESMNLEQATNLPGAGPVATASTPELLAALAKESGELVKKEIELAKSEMRFDVKRELQMAGGLGVAAICALAAFNLLLVAVVFALADALPSWAAALLIAGAMLVIGTLAGLIGWTRRVKRPLDKTQKTLKEDVRWAKGRVA